MRQFPLFFLFIIAVLLLPPHRCQSEGLTKNSDIKVAVFIDLNGVQGSLGQQALNGFLLGWQTAPPHLTQRIFLKIVNAKSNLELTQYLAEQIAPTVDIAAGFTDNNSIYAAGKAFEKSKVPFLSIGATDPTLPSKFSNYVFLTPFGDNLQAEAAAEFGSKTFGKTCAIVWDNTSDYTRGLRSYFKSYFEKISGKIVLEESFEGGCSIKEIGEKIHSLEIQPDFIYLATLPDCIGEILFSLRSASVKLPVIGGDSFDTPTLKTEARNNVWYTTHAWLSTENKDPAIENFLKLYSQAYQTAPTHSFAALGFDSANLILQTIQQTQHATSTTLLKRLEETQDFPGATGKITFTHSEHNPNKPVWIMQIKEGETSLAQEYIRE
ncbi:MAG: ABC transporter substrate-binding protein [Parachlamydiales bacterium]|jgi:branched-chain amino acid transport system substrate-binding protein